MNEVRLHVFLLTCITRTVSSVNLKDVCDKDDLECQKPNIDNIGELKHGKCQRDNILRRLQDRSVLDCVQECLVTGGCTGINYRKNWKMCDLVGRTKNDFTEEPGCFYSPISTWPKSLAGRCAGHNSGKGNKCVMRNGKITKERSYCRGSLKVRHSTYIEKFGLYRNLRAGNKCMCDEGYEMLGKPFVVCKDNGRWERLFCCIPTDFIPRDCNDKQGEDGEYEVFPRGRTACGIDVYCDMETDGGKWLVIQRRVSQYNGQRMFNRTWKNYEYSFGRRSVNYDYWLGNVYLYQLTSKEKYELRIDLEDFSGNKASAYYSKFSISHKQSGFAISVGGYSGTAGDSLAPSNGMIFYTYDKDNKYNCAKEMNGGWWYKDCHYSSLNGIYFNETMYDSPNGTVWYTWKNESLKQTQMMIRRKGK